MKILIASDLTARSDRALARAFLLAQELGAEIQVLHVGDEELPNEFKEHSMQWARAVRLDRSTLPAVVSRAQR